MFLYILIAGIVILALLGILVITFYNKFQFALIKIDEAENNVDILLEKKLDLFSRLFPLIKEKVSFEEGALPDFEKLKEEHLNHFELCNILQKAAQSFHIILDNHPDLLEAEPIDHLIEEWIIVDDDLDAAIRYYNDNVVLYNKLVRCFPSNIIRLLFHYKTKEFYSNEKEEVFEILKAK